MVHLKNYREAGIAAEQQGGFVQWLPRHAVMFYPRSKRLMVTFDNMKSRESPAPVYPWGHQFVADNGWSHLGIMMIARNDWFRHKTLWEYLEVLKKAGLFAAFDEVVFYGSSMGGYGALAYASLSPGARVVALTPQTSLDPNVAPFEDRYPGAYRRGNWSGPYADAVDGAASAHQVCVIADPFFEMDVAHIARLPQHNLTWLKCPHMEHQATRILHNIGVLGSIVEPACRGDISEERFNRLLSGARATKPSARLLIRSAIQKGHYGLAKQALHAVEDAHPEWRFSPLWRNLRQAQQGGEAH